MEHQTKINFDPVKHLYTDDNGLVYTSVTTLIGKYKVPFNKRYWSMYSALRDCGFAVRPVKGFKGIMVDGSYKSLDYLYKNPINRHEVHHVTKEWQRLTDEACNRGNNVHDFLEDSINVSKGDVSGRTNDIIKPSLQLQGELLKISNKHDLDKTDVGSRYPKIYKRLLDYINMGCILFAEKRVYSTTYQVAGMIDVLVLHPKTRQFAILDWKTNKDEMLFKSGYYKKQTINGERVKTNQWVDKKSYLLKPLDDVEDCKGMVYSLQLSLYAYIMVLWGYKLVNNGLEIFHIRPQLEPKLIKVPYLGVQIERMLKHHLHNRVRIDAHDNTLFGVR